MNESNINSKKSIIQNIKNFKIYLNERFPLGKNSFFVLIFTLSGYIYTSLLYNSKIMYLFTNGVKIGIFQYKIIETEIPMDKRHNSKTDYKRLEELKKEL